MGPGEVGGVAGPGASVRVVGTGLGRHVAVVDGRSRARDRTRTRWPLNWSGSYEGEEILELHTVTATDGVRSVFVDYPGCATDVKVGAAPRLGESGLGRLVVDGARSATMLLPHAGGGQAGHRSDINLPGVDVGLLPSAEEGLRPSAGRPGRRSRPGSTLEYSARQYVMPSHEDRRRPQAPGILDPARLEERIGISKIEDKEGLPATCCNVDQGLRTRVPVQVARGDLGIEMS